MGYLHIENLYKCQDVLHFKAGYALEKVHGTSAAVSYADGVLSFFPGGESATRFEALFDKAKLLEGMSRLGAEVTVYGEAYGGSCQGMAHVYGPTLRFIVFDVKIGDTWLSVPEMQEAATALGLDVVPWALIPMEPSMLDRERDYPSEVAKRNGVAGDQLREGIVIRPLIEVQHGDGRRVIAKYKSAAFEERKTPQKIGDPAKLAVLSQANAIAEEWVTDMRLTHVLDKLPQGIGLDSTKLVIDAMVNDVLREAAGEIVDSKEARAAIGKRAAQLFKARVTSLRA